MYLTLFPTTNSATTAELRIRIEDEDILERDEDFVIILNTMEARVEITNTTSVLILNDDGEYRSEPCSLSCISPFVNFTNFMRVIIIMYKLKAN